MENMREITESIDTYLENEKEHLRTIDAKTLKAFTDIHVQLGVPYFIKGPEKTLLQFKAYYLLQYLHGETRPSYEMRTYSDYVRSTAKIIGKDGNDDLGVCDILFLWAHKYEASLGNTEKWFAQTVVDRTANRKRKGLVTVVLGERDLPFLEESGEFIVVDFLNGFGTIRENNVHSGNGDNTKTKIVYKN